MSCHVGVVSESCRHRFEITLDPCRNRVGVAVESCQNGVSAWFVNREVDRARGGFASLAVSDSTLFIRLLVISWKFGVVDCAQVGSASLAVSVSVKFTNLVGVVSAWAGTA